MKQELHTRQTLLERLQVKQDEQSWEEFSKYYEGYIYVVLKNFGLQTEDCEDLLQEVMLKLWKAMPNYQYEKDKCKFRTWLCVIIRNTVINFRQLKATRNKQQNVQFDQIVHKLELITESEIDKISEKEWKNYVSNMAWEQLKKELSDQMRSIFEASLTESNNAKLAEQFSIAESSIRVYKMRVRKALLKEIAHLNAELGG